VQQCFSRESSGNGNEQLCAFRGLNVSIIAQYLVQFYAQITIRPITYRLPSSVLGQQVVYYSVTSAMYHLLFLCRFHVKQTENAFDSHNAAIS
jgi:hypothetical protein